MNPHLQYQQYRKNQSRGVQQLLEAERRASEKVAEARRRKARRIKQAKQEAQYEAEKYREEKERKFKAYEESLKEWRIRTQAKIDVETQRQLNQLDQLMMKNKSKVARGLINIIQNVQCEMHRNQKFLSPDDYDQHTNHHNGHHHNNHHHNGHHHDGHYHTGHYHDSLHRDQDLSTSKIVVRLK